MEIATSISCFKEEYGPYLEPIYPPFSADHGKLPYGELKYRYSQLMLLLGESNKDKDSISYILTQPVED